MSLKKLFVIALATVAGLLYATSCKEEKPIEVANITVTPDAMDVDSVAGTYTVELKSNMPWTVDVAVNNPWGDEEANFAENPWLSVDMTEGPATAEDTPVTVTISVTKNEADTVVYDRSANIFFRTATGIFASVTVNQKGRVAKPNTGGPEFISIDEFLKKEESDKYYLLAGKVENIENTTYGNFTLTDETGSVYVYGLTKEKVPSNDKSFSSLGIQNGDVIVLAGTRSSYSGSPQVGGPAYYAVVSVADFLAKEETADFYCLAGKVEKIENTTYGNFTLTDKTGSVYVYGLTKEKVPSNDKSFSSLGIKEGDMLAMAGTRSSYGGSPQVGGPAYHMYHAGAVAAEPEVEAGEAVIGEDLASATITSEYSANGKEITEAGVVYGIKGAEETATVKADKVESPFTVNLSGLEKEKVYEYYAYVKVGEDLYKSEPKEFIIRLQEKVLKPSELVKVIRGLESGASLATYGDYVEGIVTANNESGNISGAMIVEDGTGAAGSGLYLYDYNMKQLNVGDKARIALKNAKLDIYNGLYEIKWDKDVYNEDVTLVSSGNTFTTPEITIAEMENYREMFVKVKNLKLDGTENRPWNGNVTFTDGTDKVTVRSGSKTPWADKFINAEYTGTMAAVVGYFNSIQLLPVNENDLKEFMGEAPVENNVYEWELQNGDFGKSDAPETALTKGTPELAWNVVYNWQKGTYLGFDNNDSKKGVQFGSNGNPISSVALETTAKDLNVAKVKVNASMASKGDMTLQVFADGTALGEPLKMTETATEYTFSLPAAKKGAVIKIEMKATVKACYIKSIKFE